MGLSLTPPLKWHGGKHYLAGKIIGLMPPRQSADHPDGWCHYVEPYAGGLSVLLANDPEGISEVVNDLDGRLNNFWHCLCRPVAFEAFERQAQALPFSEDLWAEAAFKLSVGCGKPDEVCVPCGLAFFVHCRQSLAGRRTSFAALSKNRTRRGMNEQASAWLNAVDGLRDVHERLRRVVVLGPKEALDVIRSEDSRRTLFYLDPPYLHETRATTTEYGPHEMTWEQHEKLLRLLSRIEGRFLLSGYRSALYDDAATVCGWKRHDFELPNNAAAGDSKRRMIESVWTNY